MTPPVSTSRLRIRAAWTESCRHSQEGVGLATWQLAGDAEGADDHVLGDSAGVLQAGPEEVPAHGARLDGNRGQEKRCCLGALDALLTQAVAAPAARHHAVTLDLCEALN